MPFSTALVETAADFGFRVLTTNSTASGVFAGIANLTASPMLASGLTTGYVNCAYRRQASQPFDPTQMTDDYRGTLASPMSVSIYPIGTAAANKDFNFRVYGVRNIQNYQSATAGESGWAHIPLIQCNAVLGAGVTGRTNELWADDITVTYQNCTIRGPYDIAGFANLIGAARVQLDIEGFQYLYFDFTTNGAGDAAASMNCIINFF